MIGTLCQRLRLSGVCLLATLAVSGCQDSSSDPFAVVLPDGDVAGFMGDGALPSLGSLAAEAELETALGGSLELWSESWDRPLLEGRELRAGAYQEVAGPLAGALGRPGLERTLAQLGEALGAAAALDQDALGTRVVDQVGEASSARDRAIAALEARDEEGALVHALIASDLIREVGPESVIRVLIRQAEGRLQALAAEPGSTSAEDVERGERLVRGARVALESGDWVRAARRAYYACQLLGIQPD